MRLPAVLGLAMSVLVPVPAVSAGGEQSCDVRVDITDTDPKGTNVRAAPGGAIVAALKNPGEGWIEVHIEGQQGDWYRIDRAYLMEADLPPGGTLLFEGKGYLHRSVLGVSGMQNGGAVYADHHSGSALVDPHAAGDQPVELLGCYGDFLKVHVGKGTGWTRQVCTNMITTCA